MDLLRQKAWRFICATFPERQLYIRSDGRVQFFTFSPLTQAVMAGVSLLFLGWVAFTSVNVIFKDRILTAKERRFEQMQASYESRIADLQLSYDELNGALISAEDQFKSVADGFEAKQNALSELIERKQNLRASLSPARPNPPSAKPPVSQSSAPAVPALKPALPPAPSLTEPGGVGGAFEATAPDADADLAPPFAGGNRAQGFKLFEMDSASDSATLEEHSEAIPERSDHVTFLSGAMQRLGSYFRRKTPVSRQDHPILKVATAQGARIARLEMEAPSLLAEAKSDIDSQTTKLTREMGLTGINTKAFMARLQQKHSERAPLFPVTGALPGTNDEDFNAQVSEAATSIGKLGDVVAALRAVPLVAPTTGEVSSGFGERVDPFNENLAFHSGVDFSGPKGTGVQATSSGIVVFTGPRGAYGNTVEIDHGYGVRTRYAHLSAIGVRVGAKVEKGAVIGRVGSTGRSTGPHVHYEVWYDDAVKDPSKFIKVGRDVLQE
jgi:murein DD-endopeptidase MepM/ murein hydrolase activator NlpD